MNENPWLSFPSALQYLAGQCSAIPRDLKCDLYCNSGLHPHHTLSLKTAETMFCLQSRMWGVSIQLIQVSSFVTTLSTKIMLILHISFPWIYSIFLFSTNIKEVTWLSFFLLDISKYCQKVGNFPFISHFVNCLKKSSNANN